MNEYAVERLLKALQSLTNEIQLFREAYVAHNSPRVERKDEPQTCNDCDQQRCETCVTEIGKTEPHIDDFFRNPTAEEIESIREYIDSISISTGVNVFDLMNEL